VSFVSDKIDLSKSQGNYSPCSVWIAKSKLQTVNVMQLLLAKLADLAIRREQVNNCEPRSTADISLA
jgi:hypothetical protein